MCLSDGIYDARAPFSDCDQPRDHGIPLRVLHMLIIPKLATEKTWSVSKIWPIMESHKRLPRAYVLATARGPRGSWPPKCVLVVIYTGLSTFAQAYEEHIGIVDLTRTRLFSSADRRIGFLRHCNFHTLLSSSTYYSALDLDSELGSIENGS